MSYYKHFLEYTHCTSEMSTVTILLLFHFANSANTLWTSKLLDLSQTHLWEDLKASAHFATEVLKQVTVSSHLQPHSSTREATCLYTSGIHIRLAERHRSPPESHTSLSWSPCRDSAGDQCSSMVPCSSRTFCSCCLSGHLQKTLKYFCHAMFYHWFTFASLGKN